MKPVKFLFLFYMLLLCGAAIGQSKNCKEIDVTVEITRTPSGQSNLKITIHERGKFRAQLLDANGKIRELTSLDSNVLAKGGYDLVITDLSNGENRCPYYKRIQIEGQ